MKKVIFLSRLYAPHIGGVEKHIQKLSKELIKKEYDITVLTTSHGPNLPKEQVIEGVRVFRFEHIDDVDKLATWRGIFQFRKLILSHDVIHIHDVFWWIIPLLPFFIFLNKKVFITFHGYEGNEEPSWRQKFWHRFAELFTNGNICIGGFHEKWYGVTPTKTSFGATESIQKPTDLIKKDTGHVRIFYSGRLAEDTGILTYLEACKMLKESQIKFSLDVYGDGELRQKAELFSKQHALPVKFLGFKKDFESKIIDYDIAFVSRYLAITETLANSVPVIAQYNNQIKKDYLALSPFNKWITITDNPDKIAEAVSKIKPLSSQASTWARQQTWERMAQVYIDLWNSKS